SLVRALALHAYTTHVRQLETLLWRALAGSRGNRLEPCAETGLHRPAQDAAASPRPPRAPRTAGAAASVGLTPEVIQAALDAHNGSIEDTWPALGLRSRFALHRLIRKHRLVIRKGPGS